MPITSDSSASRRMTGKFHFEMNEGALTLSEQEKLPLVLEELLAGEAKELASDDSMAANFGRGVVERYLSNDGNMFVLRRYMRGGFAKKLSTNRFFTLSDTYRPFEELRTLLLLSNNGVQVPKPAAAIVSTSLGGLSYTGAIATFEIPEAKNLLLALKEDVGADALELLSEHAGLQAAKSIALGIHHVDLHPGNVLVTSPDEVWIIDFDRAKAVSSGTEAAIIERWSRSVRKHGGPESMIEGFKHGLRSETQAGGPQ